MRSAHTELTDTIKVLKGLKAKQWMPMHYRTFNLSDEPIYYPEKILIKQYQEAIAYIIWMQIGEEIALFYYE